MRTKGKGCPEKRLPAGRINIDRVKNVINLFVDASLNHLIYMDLSRAILSSVLGWVEKSEATAFPLRGLTMNI